MIRKKLMPVKKKPVILVVDDVAENIDVFHGILSANYQIRAATNGEDALEIASSAPFADLILLDIMMPKMDGYEVLTKLKAKKLTMNIPVMFVTTLDDTYDEQKGLEIGAVDYITKPISPPIVKARIHNHLLLKQHQDDLEELVCERTRELEMTREVTIESMAALAEFRDPETGGHIQRTKSYVRRLAEHLQYHDKYKNYLNKQTIDLLYTSAPLHDIGKVGVRDSILLKPGKLTTEEFAEMKLHTKYGRDTLRVAEKKLGSDSFLRYAREIAYSHHEKWDGSGYPLGLAGNNIPVPGRLMAIADIYDALISKRIYKPPFPHKKAVSIMIKGKGSHFDPDMADAFMELNKTFRQIALKFADFEEERQMLKL